jgi:flagellar hook protein FlgE
MKGWVSIMMRSLFAGVSGLRNHQIKMDVIGNNIANINTIGFKKARANFQDVFSQNVRNSTPPTAERGGVNPLQIGLGTSLASVDNSFEQGKLQITERESDIAIQGAGFFIVNDSVQNLYTRVGTIEIDASGHFVHTATGNRLQGWLPTRSPDTGSIMIDRNKAIGDLDINGDDVRPGKKLPANATSTVHYGCNLDQSQPIGASHVTAIGVHDSLGREYSYQMRYEKMDTITWTENGETKSGNVWGYTASLPGDTPLNTPDTSTINPKPISLNLGDADGDGFTGFVVFDVSTGRVASGATAVQNGLIATADDYVDGMEIVARTNFVPSETDGGVASALPVQIYTNFDEVTEFASPMTTSAKAQNGYSLGVLETFNIDETGTITGVYSNGYKESLGQIALANFTNPSGLIKAGANMWSISTNSGLPQISAAREGGTGKISSGVLEQSNVELAAEFTDMIVTQRGFQANSRIITTADQMLQELVNLTR